jgi:16S rRNA (guanine1516-N2)-methyltransferase
MNELIKIKMSDQDQDVWPLFLTEALQTCLVLESERKLCSNCDYLFFSEGKLHFRSSELGVMCFDFEETLSYHQRQHYALSKEPLARALGIKGEQKPVIWDTTCGTGKDSLLIQTFLGAAGSKLKSFERHPAIFLLLKDAARRFPVSFEIVFADASQLSSIKDEDRPDVIFYDPMYPEKKGSKKSALPRKEMRIFKDIVGEDLDSDLFLEWALKTAKERVVVKRGLAADPVKEKPTASYEGKSTRYDMYKIF